MSEVFEYPQLALSLIYFAFISYIGLFLILRRAALFGIVLTQTAQVSFFIGLGMLLSFATDHGNDEAIHTHSLNSGEMLGFDYIIMPVTLFIMAPFIVLISKGVKNTESILAGMLVVMTAAVPLLIRLFDGSDTVLVSAYFTEILYTDTNNFYYYLSYIGVLLLLHIFCFRRFLLSGFDPIQAKLVHINAKVYNAIFYFSAGLSIAIVIRVIGIYVSMAALILPPLMALALSKEMGKVIMATLVISVVTACLGFVAAFHFDKLPTSPVIIATMGAFTIVFLPAVRFFRR